MHKNFSVASIFLLTSVSYAGYTDFDYVIGPVSAHRFKYADETFLLFGDQHYDDAFQCPPAVASDCKSKRPKHCILIQDFLQELFEAQTKKDRFSDFYLETPFVTMPDVSTERQDPGYLDYIAARFSSCFQKSKTKCSYLPYTRFHYADIRAVQNDASEAKEAIQILPISTLMGAYLSHSGKYDFDLIATYAEWRKANPQSDRELYSLFFNSDDFIRDFRKSISGLVEKMIKQHGKTRTNAYFDPFFRNLKQATSLYGAKRVHRVRKQILELKADGKGELARQLMKFGSDWFDKAMLMAQAEREKILSDPNFPKQDYSKQSKMRIMSAKPEDRFILAWSEFLKGESAQLDYRITNELAQLVMVFSEEQFYPSVGIMDAYLLARMFREFRTSSKRHESSNMRVVYAGDLHIQNYVDFFENYLGVKSKSHDVDKLGTHRCIKNPLKIDNP